VQAAGASKAHHMRLPLFELLGKLADDPGAEHVGHLQNLRMHSLIYCDVVTSRNPIVLNPRAAGRACGGWLNATNACMHACIRAWRWPVNWRVGPFVWVPEKGSDEMVSGSSVGE